jgi:two-component system, sensor histidine kinase PdtaS
MKRITWMICFLFTILSSYGQEITRHDADSMTSALNRSKGIVRIELLLNLAQFHIFKPGEIQNDFDTAIVYLKEAKLLNKSLKSSTAYGYQLLTESYLVKEEGDRVKGKKMAEQSVAILETGNNKYYLGRSCYELSMYYNFIDDQQLPLKIALVERAVGAFQQAGTLERNAYSLEMLGDLNIKAGDFTKAIDILHQTISAYKSVKYEKLQGVYTLLGQAHLYNYNESQALYYMLMALKTAQIVHDTTMQLCQINNNLGSLYSRIDRKDVAIKYLNDALAVAKKHNDQNAILLIATNIAFIYLNLDQAEPALKVLSIVPKSFLKSDNAEDRSTYAMAYFRTYLLLKQYNEAQPFGDTLLQIADNNSVNEEESQIIYRLLATYSLELKQYSKARFYLNKNLELGKKTKWEYGLIQASRVWYKLDSTEGNFRSAFNHLHYYKSKTDSLFSANREKQLQVLEVEYETAMKEDSIKLKDKDIALLTQKNSLQQANLKQASLIKNVTIAGIALAFIIIGLLYRQYTHKQKNNNIITQKNNQLQHLVTEKDWLLKEIHHRVKNNLQIVMSLLNSQSAYIDNEPALAAIHDSQHRVHAMSLIHQKLYSSENLSSIDMSFYIRELVSYLSDSFDTGQRIRFELNIAPLELDVSQAVPLGLILNEAITNSIKYAFPEGKYGVISITLSGTGSDHFLLNISDNGVGMPRNYDNKKIGSLGMSLMKGLSEDLDGNFSIENNNGTIIRVSFVHDIGIKNPSKLTASYVSQT